MDRVKREDVEVAVGLLRNMPGKPGGHPDYLNSRLLCDQTLLLLEIRDLLANPVAISIAESLEKLAKQAAADGVRAVIDETWGPPEPPRGINILTLEQLKELGYSEAAIEKLREEAIASTKPSWRPDPPTRTTWLSAEDGKAEFACAACRRLVKVREDQIRGLKGPWITLECNRCRHKHELDARELEGEIGKMMRAFSPFITEKEPGKISPSKNARPRSTATARP